MRQLLDRPPGVEERCLRFCAPAEADRPACGRGLPRALAGRSDGSATRGQLKVCDFLYGKLDKPGTQASASETGALFGMSAS